MNHPFHVKRGESNMICHVLCLVVLFISCNESEMNVPATVITLDIMDLTEYSVLCRGQIIEQGNNIVNRSGIELDDGSGYDMHTRTMISGNKFGVLFTGLTPNSTYRYRAFVDDGMVRYGEEKEFTTLTALENTILIDSAFIAQTSVIVNFSQFENFDQWGVHYSESPATKNDPSEKITQQADIIIDGLKPNTTYHILPFVGNCDSQVTYLKELSFTTGDPNSVEKSSVHNMHPYDQLRFVKYNVVNEIEPYLSAYTALIGDANEIVESAQKENSLPDFNIPGYYNDPEGHKANVAALVTDSYAAYASALAYRLSGNEKFGEKAIYFLNAWSKNNKSYSGPDGALAMARAGGGLVTAAELMTDSPMWDFLDQVQFQNWVTSVYQKAGNAIRNRKNNWADWGRYASMLSASFTEDRAEINKNVELIKSDLFDKIDPTGYMPEEVKRDRSGVWYTYFSLSPLTAASWIAYNYTGENIFELESPEGASIKKAVDYLLRYTQKPNEWPWHPEVYVGTPEKWSGNLFEALYGIYGVPAYLNYVAASRPIIYNEHHFTWTFPTLMPLSLNGYE